MIDDTMDSQILAQEEWAIKLLAHETHTEIVKVKEIFLIEYAKLAAGAHIKSFLPVLTRKAVRGVLDTQNAGQDCVRNVNTATRLPDLDRAAAFPETVARAMGPTDERCEFRVATPLPPESTTR
jgi:hypothetical protein